MPRLPAVVLSLMVSIASQAEEPLGLLELFNYYEYSPSLASSGQPTREQLPAIAAAGIEAVINLVPVDSPDAYAEEGKLVRALALDYQHIPVAWEQPTEADLEAFFAAMQAFRDKRILVHCYANARASAFVYLWRVRHGGDAAGQARAEAWDTLVRIWDWNDGYELRNVPTWSTFISRASSAP